MSIDNFSKNNDIVDNTVLIPFFEKLLENLKNNEIGEEKKKIVGEFYMKYLFLTENTNEIDIEEDDMKKFLFLGYYIYKHIINNKKIE